MAKRVTRRGFLAATGALAGATVGQSLGRAAGAPGGLKIVGVSCSLRKEKTTSAALRACLDGARQAGAGVEVELIELAGLKIDPSLAVLPPEPGQTDDFAQIEAKLADPKVGGIIIGTPTYFSGMSALCKAFLDRCMAFRRTFALRNKVGGALAVGGTRNGGQELAIQAIHAALFGQDMILVGAGRPSGRLGAALWNSSKDDLSADEWGLEIARQLGRRVAEVAALVGG